MYPVDENFETCLHSTSKWETLYGSIKLQDGTDTPLDLSNIKENSVSISWDSSDGNKDIALGVAVCAELDITLYTDFDRYALNGAQITLVYRVFNKPPVYDANQQITNGALYSDCPLGVFTAMNITKDSHNNTAHILAYDNIKLLDVACGSQVFSGRSYIILNTVASKTGIDFEMTSEYIEDNFLNASVAVQFDSTTGAKTYRDIVKYIGQLLGACSRANRETGALELWKYQTSSEVTLSRTDRKIHTPSDYSCTYSGVEIVSVKGTYRDVEAQVSGGMVMYIEDAPAWDYGTDEALATETTAIANYVRQISYTPCTSTVFNNPRYECGDMLTFTVDNDRSHDINVLVTGVKWSFRGSVELTSIGSSVETETGATSESNRTASRKSDANKLVSYDVMNTSEIELGDEETVNLCDISFTSAQSTHAMWLANILLNSEADDDYTDVKVTYKYDGVEITFCPQEHYIDGKHDFSLFFPISAISEQSVHRWQVDITSLGGTTTISQYDFRGTLFGQNLVEQAEKWDGLLTLEDFAHLVSAVCVAMGMTDSLTMCQTFANDTHTMTDTVTAVIAPNELINTTEECIIKFRYREDICFCGEGYYAGTDGVLL